MKARYKILCNGQIYNNREKKYLPQYKNKDGYLCCSMDGKGQRVHRVILEHFKGKPSGLECDHIDGVRDNNNLFNLEWVTHKENIKRATLKGSYKNNPLRMGQAHGRAVLNDMKVLAIRTMPSPRPNGQGAGWPHTVLSKLFKVSATRIANIRKGTEWTHLPHIKLNSYHTNGKRLPQNLSLKH